jgi:hypothetical protein
MSVAAKCWRCEGKGTIQVGREIQMCPACGAPTDKRALTVEEAKAIEGIIAAAQNYTPALGKSEPAKHVAPVNISVRWDAPHGMLQAKMVKP